MRRTESARTQQSEGMLDHLFDWPRDVEFQDVLLPCGCFQRAELTVEQGSRHEVATAMLQTAVDEFSRSG